MKISKDKPVIYERLRAAFGIDWEKGVIITWRGVVYTISGKLTPDLEVHEKIHIRQQEEAPDLDRWLDLYISTPSFRFKQEREAYKAQADYLRKKCRDEDELLRRLQHIWRSMAEMYGGMITYEEAKKTI